MTRQRVNMDPVPAIIVTSDDDDVNDGEDPRYTQLDPSRPLDLHIDTLLGPCGLPKSDRCPKTFWDASIPIPSPSTTSTSAATQGSESLFSPLVSVSSRSSLDDGGLFDISKEALCELLDRRDLSLLKAYGGIDGIATRLASNCTWGLDTCSHGALERSEQFPTGAARRSVFGSNRIPDRKPKTLWVCTQESLRDPAAWIFVLINTFSMMVSFLEGKGGSMKWMEGIPGIVVLVGAIAWGVAMAWKIDREFVCILKRTTDRQVKVVRGGSIQLVSMHDIMVGDIICLEQGDLVPADGLLVSGRNIKCDESCLTGESELVAKAEAPRGGAWDAQYPLPDPGYGDPFIISGSSIIEGGAGRCLVTGVGANSKNGRLMQHVRTTSMEEQTPLQQRVCSLTGTLSSLALGIVVLFFIIILRRDFPMDMKRFLMDLQMAIVLVLVSVPEGLPMSVTIALISARRRGMWQNRIFVSRLSSCETMGNATALCCDKTGTLTTNEMEVAAGMIGIMGRFSIDSHRLDGAVTHEDLAFPWQEICPKVRDLFVKSAAINSTAFESERDGMQTYVGSGTETALLRFARNKFGLGSLAKDRENTRVVESIPFDSRRKCMATVTKVSDQVYRMYVKGAPETLLENSEHTIQGPADLTQIAMTRERLLRFTSAIAEDGSKSLRMLGLAYRDFPSWPPPDTGDMFDHVSQGLVFFGLVGIHDPLRPGVRDTVAKCQGAGIAVRLVTGDSKITAAAVARECGILGPDDQAELVMEGPEFRNLSADEMSRVLPRLRVLARSIPEDKKLMVTKLKELGETVAVTGDGTNDGPALRAADVGIALGKSGTEVAKEASSIVLLDDDFASIVDVIALGRGVYDAVRRFLQFQLTANLSVLALSAAFAIRLGVEESIFTMPEMLWINLIMDLFGALALSTDGPAKQVLNRPPEKRTTWLLGFTNYKMIILQASYHFILVLVIMSWGGQLVELLDPSVEPESDEAASWMRTLASSTYISMLLFNLFNSRSPSNGFNILQGIHKNKIFIGAALCIVSIQVLWISFGGQWFQVTRLNSASWAFSAGAGFVTIPLGMAIRCFPDARFLALGECIASTAALLQASFSRLVLGAKHVLLKLSHLLVLLATNIETKGFALALHNMFRLSELWTSLFPSFTFARWIQLSPRFTALMGLQDVPDDLRRPLLGHENV
ncbi:calcium-transporting ATPase 2 [Rhypophila decipiens]|uniref:Calcium-transporting ATPase 2 n=1 Tax=Rhypophila decipiens TaxID=261697 RepID=A0AAN7B817_9PEZI|nr:calcium-transporting ATPase 2 [Rhypophila decipiens]